jgi:hypothetical protein
LPLFTGIDRSIKYRTAIPILNRSSKELFKAMDRAFRIYNKAGFRVTEVYCDQEFKHMMDKVSDDLEVEMNYTTTGEHVPEAERNNRTLKERIRAAFHNLPFRAIPKLMLGYLATVCCLQLNFCPAKTGVSAFFTSKTSKSSNWTKYFDLEKTLDKILIG